MNLLKANTTKASQDQLLLPNASLGCAGGEQSLLTCWEDRELVGSHGETCAIWNSGWNINISCEILA